MLRNQICSVNGKKFENFKFFYKNYKEYNNMEDTSEICQYCYEEIKKYGFCVTNCLLMYFVWTVWLNQ